MCVLGAESNNFGGVEQACAIIMAAKVAKGSIRKSKPVVSKTSLNSPFQRMWNPVVGEDMQFILQTLMEKFKQLGLKKTEFRVKSTDKKTKRSKESSDGKGGKKISAGEAPMESAGEAPMESAGEAPEEKTEVPGWTDRDLRQQLAIGINEVTRALEKNDLYLVIVCKSAKPDMITKHIIELSASREVPACQLPRLSENIAPVLGLKSVLALGFKRSSDVFVEEMKAIAPRLPPLDVPWLQSGTKKTEGLEDSSLVDDAKTQNTESTTSRKRKRAKTKDPGNVVLQGLKVKKIVPNPNKKRKIKKKKILNKK
ncbi:ribonuclease P protein subunit p38 isoform X2 [Pseudophryne corroboree]|uniref:ribonuclease P protein subunit p38 isoform X2 n=1 Tax=Pseudophryne corroboree TaxID=495146 RepID=UPI003081BAEA